MSDVREEDVLVPLMHWSSSRCKSATATWLRDCVISPWLPEHCYHSRTQCQSPLRRPEYYRPHGREILYLKPAALFVGTKVDIRLHGLAMYDHRRNSSITT